MGGDAIEETPRSAQVNVLRATKPWVCSSLGIASLLRHFFKSLTGGGMNRLLSRTPLPAANGYIYVNRMNLQPVADSTDSLGSQKAWRER
jgi:hypothetical protein